MPKHFWCRIKKFEKRLDTHVRTSPSVKSTMCQISANFTFCPLLSSQKKVTPSEFQFLSFKSYLKNFPIKSDFTEFTKVDPILHLSHAPSPCVATKSLKILFLEFCKESWFRNFTSIEFIPLKFIVQNPFKIGPLNFCPDYFLTFPSQFGTLNFLSSFFLSIFVSHHYLQPSAPTKT